MRIGFDATRLSCFKAEPMPTPGDAVVRVFVDEELGREGFTYELASGRLGTVHVEQVLKYNQDPSYLRNQSCSSTLEAQKRVAGSPLSKREIVRRLGTSVPSYRSLSTRRTTASRWISCWRCSRCSTATSIWWSG